MKRVAWSLNVLRALNANKSRYFTSTNALICIVCITSLECTAPQTKLRQVDGKWPTHGYDGRPLPDYPEKGMWLAGGWRAVLDGFQGDADWFHKLFHYKRPSTLSHEIFFVTNL